MVSSSPTISFDEALAQATDGRGLDEHGIIALLDCGDADSERLFATADEVRRRFVGNDVHLRALIEFSNHCRKNCDYCGIRARNRNVSRYRLSPEEIVSTARQAADSGFGTVVLQSGEDAWFTRDRMACIIRAIKTSTGMAITLGVGERDESTYRAWRDAGADRFLLRIETTDPDLFRRLHPDDDLDARKACLVALRDLGYQVGSGVMVGLPGQTLQTLARDVIWMRDFGVEMIGIGPFLPHPETPLAQALPGTINLTLRLVATLRLVFPYGHIPATTAMGSLLPGGRERALAVGANVLMPNMTPRAIRDDYALYPDKVGLDATSDDRIDDLHNRILALGRTIAKGPGHVARHCQGES